MASSRITRKALFNTVGLGLDRVRPAHRRDFLEIRSEILVPRRIRHANRAGGVVVLPESSCRRVVVSAVVSVNSLPPLHSDRFGNSFLDALEWSGATANAELPEQEPLEP